MSAGRLGAGGRPPAKRLHVQRSLSHGAPDVSCERLAAVWRGRVPDSDGVLKIDDGTFHVKGGRRQVGTVVGGWMAGWGCADRMPEGSA